MFLDKIKPLVNAHRVISFDIFDTLLIRPYVRPADLFLHLENCKNNPGGPNTAAKRKMRPGVNMPNTKILH